MYFHIIQAGCLIVKFIDKKPFRHSLQVINQYKSLYFWLWHNLGSELWTPYSHSSKIRSFIGVSTDIRDCGVLGSTLSVKLYTLQLCGAELELNRFWSRRRRRWFYYKRSHLTSWRSHSWFPFALIVRRPTNKK